MKRDKREIFNQTLIRLIKLVGLHTWNATTFVSRVQRAS
mgnify:CR=1 FL=1